MRKRGHKDTYHMATQRQTLRRIETQGALFSVQESVARAIGGDTVVAAEDVDVDMGGDAGGAVAEEAAPPVPPAAPPAAMLWPSGPDLQQDEPAASGTPARGGRGGGRARRGGRGGRRAASFEEDGAVASSEVAAPPRKRPRRVGLETSLSDAIGQAQADLAPGEPAPAQPAAAATSQEPAWPLAASAGRGARGPRGRGRAGAQARGAGEGQVGTRRAGRAPVGNREGLQVPAAAAATAVADAAPQLPSEAAPWPGGRGQTALTLLPACEDEESSEDGMSALHLFSVQAAPGKGPGARRAIPADAEAAAPGSPEGNQPSATATSPAGPRGEQPTLQELSSGPGRAAAAAEDPLSSLLDSLIDSARAAS